MRDNATLISVMLFIENVQSVADPLFSRFRNALDTIVIARFPLLFLAVRQRMKSRPPLTRASHLGQEV